MRDSNAIKIIIVLLFLTVGIISSVMEQRKKQRMRRPRTFDPRDYPPETGRAETRESNEDPWIHRHEIEESEGPRDVPFPRPLRTDALASNALSGALGRPTVGNPASKNRVAAASSIGSSLVSGRGFKVRDAMILAEILGPPKAMQSDPFEVER